MEIICPTCNASYKINAAKIPAKGASATCKKCGGRITFQPNEAMGVAFGVAQPSRVEQPRQVAPEPPPAALGPGSPGLQASGAGSGKPFLMDFPELSSLPPDMFALEEIITPDKKGKYVNRPNKHKVKILSAIRDVLPKILKKDEKVMRVAQGIAHHPVEMLFGNGALTMIYNQYAIVCTNRRLLFVNTNYRLKHPTHYFFQMAYENIGKVKTGFMGARLILGRIHGKGNRIFTGVKRYFTKELRQFIELKARAAPTVTANPTDLALENLCPSCYVPLNKGLVSCSSCRTDFKEPRKAFLKSLALPGWGDLYLGHKLLGSLELVGSIILWAMAALALASGDTDATIFVLVLLVFYNGADGLVTYHMAKKGYMAAR